jgi:hypothetical protein
MTDAYHFSIFKGLDTRVRKATKRSSAIQQRARSTDAQGHGPYRRDTTEARGGLLQSKDAASEGWKQRSGPEKAGSRRSGKSDTPGTCYSCRETGKRDRSCKKRAHQSKGAGEEAASQEERSRSIIRRRHVDGYECLKGFVLYNVSLLHHSTTSRTKVQCVVHKRVALQAKVIVATGAGVSTT